MRISRKWLALPLKLAVSGALIWFLFGNVDLGAAKARLADIAPAMVILATVVLVAQTMICARRWQAVLDAIRSPLPFLTALRIFFIERSSIRRCHHRWEATRCACTRRIAPG